VVESGSRPRLVQETLLRPWVGRQHRGEELERYPASQEGVLGTVDDSHPAGPGQAEDPVSRYRGASRFRRAREAARQAFLACRPSLRRWSHRYGARTTCKVVAHRISCTRIAGIRLTSCGPLFVSMS
jgi:hypothetical protein